MQVNRIGETDFKICFFMFLCYNLKKIDGGYKMERKILLIDSDVEMHTKIKEFLKDEADYTVFVAGSGREAVQMMNQEMIDMLILDVDLQEMDSMTTLDNIRKLPNGSKIPVIFTGISDKKIVLQTRSKGADGYLAKPFNQELLKQKIKEILKRIEHYQEAKTILIVDDDPEFLKRANLHLDKFYKPVPVKSGKAALEYLNDHRADGVILDYKMPLYSGSTVLNMLRKKEQTKTLPVIVMSALDLKEIRELCGQFNPYGYLSKPVSIDDLLEMVHTMFEQDGVVQSNVAQENTQQESVESI